MTHIVRHLTVVALLLTLFNSTPSWGGATPAPSCSIPGCNSTTSDDNGNTAGGTGALINVDETPSTGGLDNTAFGFHALNLNTTGTWNTAIGSGTLPSNTTGTANTAVGTGTLGSNTIGFGNTGVGMGVLAANVAGVANTAIGGNALFASTGDKNTATGSFALVKNTTGSANTSTGFQALFWNNVGSKNTALGADALLNSTGNKNIGIGYQAGVDLTSGNNNIYIGSVSGESVESQTIRIGKAQVQTFMAGIATANLGSGELVAIDPATGQLGVAVLSSARYKQGIAPMGARSEGILQLKPVTFAYKDDAQGILHYGLVAEEVAAVYPQLVTYAPTGEVRTVRYQELIPMLLNELQRQQQTLESQAHALQRQQQELAELRSLMEQRRSE